MDYKEFYPGGYWLVIGMVGMVEMSNGSSIMIADVAKISCM